MRIVAFTGGQTVDFQFSFGQRQLSAMFLDESAKIVANERQSIDIHIAAIGEQRQLEIHG
jgi:hypothetical protein